MSDMTYEVASSLLDLDPETGHLYWKRPVRKSLEGRPAGCVNSRGYVVVQVRGVLYLAHRVVWLLAHGVSPSFDVDHINGIRSDNRPDNLRDVPRERNNQNIRGAYSSSSTGLLGAYQNRRRNCYQSSIHVEGRTVYLGQFKTAEEAHAAYMKAKRELHPGFIQLLARMAA